MRTAVLVRRGDSSTDWDLLGEAAAEIARYKIQQQADRSSSSRGGGDGGTGWSSRRIVRLVRQTVGWARDFPGWLLYRFAAVACWLGYAY